MKNIFVEFLPPWVETGLQPAFYDKESGTVLQQTARMYDRVNMLIRMFNKLSKNTKEEIEEFEQSVNDTVNDYIERFNTLYNYVHDYFDNLDVQAEVDHKLDEMAEDGTLEEIIDQRILSNVKTNITRLYQDKKFKPILYASLYAPDAEMDMDKVKLRISKWVEMGIYGMIPIIHFNTDAELSLQENLTDILELIEYAKGLGLAVDTVKFHWLIGNDLTDTTQLDTYETRVEQVLSTMDAQEIGITRITILNECRKAYTHLASAEMKAKVVELINNFKDLGYTVGITPSETWDMNDIIQYSKSVADAVDFISFNQYPGISFKKSLTNKEDSIHAWDEVFDCTYNYKQLYPTKNIILSETGCTNFWSNLMNPSEYNLIDAENSGGKTYPLYYYGMFNNAVVNTNFSEVWLWYTEDITKYDEVVDWFKNYTGGTQDDEENE